MFYTCSIRFLVTRSFFFGHMMSVICPLHSNVISKTYTSSCRFYPHLELYQLTECIPSKTIIQFDYLKESVVLWYIMIYIYIMKSSCWIHCRIIVLDWWNLRAVFFIPWDFATGHGVLDLKCLTGMQTYSRPRCTMHDA